MENSQRLHRSSLKGPSPGATNSTVAAEIVELVVFTTDDVFLRTLREALSGSRRIWHVAAADKVSDLLIAGEVGILVLDVMALNEPAGGFLSHIKRQFPDLVIIVAGKREAEVSLGLLISSGTVHRFIHKPLSPARARLFADAAVKRYTEQRRRPAGKPLPAAAAPRRRGLMLGAAGIALMFLAAAAWVAMRGTRNVDPQPAAGAALVSSGESPLLTRAAAALAANRLTQPTGDNALQWYLQLQARNPSDPAARAGLAEVRERLAARAENALLEERLDEAAAAIDTARRAGVDNGRIVFLSGQLTRARERHQGTVTQLHKSDAHAPGDAASPIAQQADAAPPATPAATEAESWDRLLQNGLDRLQQDRLIEPQDDSAKYYLLTLRSANPGNPGLAAALQDLGARFVTKARRALALQQAAAARSWLEEAAAIGYAAADFSDVRRELDAAAEKQRFSSDVINAGELKLMKSVPVVYPHKAEQARTEGWVDLEFTVGDDGSVRDIDVRDAKPTGTFDSAAISALAQWHYQPPLRDGVPAAQRARIRIRFALAQ